MPRTIVQEYGPIYGEPVNGTVMGRPNGSVYVPSSNTIVFDGGGAEYLKYWESSWGANYFVYCDSSGVIIDAAYNAVAVAQDLASNIVISLYSDEALTNLVGQISYPAGQFNILDRAVVVIDKDSLTSGDTLYLVATLNNNNVPVAASAAYSIQYLVVE